MNTRELEDLSRIWPEPDLTTALRAFLRREGRLPGYHDLMSLLFRLRAS